jgi:tripartite-type tricarboxylate transporter receptor subunit TctC
VARWNEVLKVALQDPETLKRLAAVGVDPLYSTPEEFAAYIRAEVPKWAQVVKASGARAD